MRLISQERVCLRFRIPKLDFEIMTVTSDSRENGIPEINRLCWSVIPARDLDRSDRRPS